MLEPLLVKTTHPEVAGCAALRGVAYWLARAFRRMARIVSVAALALVRDTLRLVDAWPANPLRLPDRKLSETATRTLGAQAKWLQLPAKRMTRAARLGDAREPEIFEAGVAACRSAIRALRAGWQQLRLGICGNRHQWRLR